MSDVEMKTNTLAGLARSCALAVAAYRAEMLRSVLLLGRALAPVFARLAEIEESNRRMAALYSRTLSRPSPLRVIETEPAPRVVYVYRPAEPEEADGVM